MLRNDREEERDMYLVRKKRKGKVQQYNYRENRKTREKRIEI